LRSRAQTTAAWLWVLPVAVFVYFSVVRPWPV